MDKKEVTEALKEAWKELADPEKEQWKAKYDEAVQQYEAGTTGYGVNASLAILLYLSIMGLLYATGFISALTNCAQNRCFNKEYFS
jgi:hypothetical protein